MEIVKSDVRTITLESYSIEREASGEPVTIRAELQIATPAMKPETMRLRVKYQFADLPNRDERDLARRLLELLRSRLYDRVRERVTSSGSPLHHSYPSQECHTVPASIFR
jgi:hypothetical protein